MTGRALLAEAAGDREESEACYERALALHRDRKKNMGNIRPPISSPARFAAVTVRLRKNDSGSSGAADRVSMTANAAMSAAAPACTSGGGAIARRSPTARVPAWTR
jgi:hypothetical protein